MTYAPCDPTISNQCKDGYSLTECYGGNSKYFAFISDTLVPTVLAELNLILGEVSIYGFSLGGLTACNAVLERPDFFSRAMCSSPSLWFNYGDFSRKIRDTFEQNPTQNLPQSVVLSLGTAEDGVYPNFQVEGEYTYWTEFIADTKNAWLSVGLNRDTLSYFTLEGGIHTGISYADDVLIESAKQLYKSNFPSPNQDQSSAYISYVFPSGSDSCEDETCSEEQKLINVLVILLALTWLGILCVALCTWYSRRRADSLLSEGVKSSELTPRA
jgi:hypothetical protein